jgi:hypothetical protein
LARWSKAPVAAQGPSRWYVSGKKSLWALARETLDSLGERPNRGRMRTAGCRPYSVAATVEVNLQLTSRDNAIAAPNAVTPISGTAPVAEVVDLIGGHMKEWTDDALSPSSCTS